MRYILLAGRSCSGKSTLAKALASSDVETCWFSTSGYLRQQNPVWPSNTGSGDRPTHNITPEALRAIGDKLDLDNPGWLPEALRRYSGPMVVDSVRSNVQDTSFGNHDVIRINVVASDADVTARLAARGDSPRRGPDGWLFDEPDYVWNSSVIPLSRAVGDIGRLSGNGKVDAIIGGQYGSEGKGKLAAILAPGYEVLARSGGPNAGHWVRTRGQVGGPVTTGYEYCFHHLPSGSIANRGAMILIGAGATINRGLFEREVEEVGCQNRMVVDRNVVLIGSEDVERESEMVGTIGSTAQGVGSATARRVMRGSDVLTIGTVPWLRGVMGNVSEEVQLAVEQGDDVLMEGTQGTCLSLWHGDYPYVTSRDTNVGGLAAEIGVAPSAVGDVWMVVRSYPIRVGGNSGPLEGELSWDDISGRSGIPKEDLLWRELTSTTKRLRRIGQFNWGRFRRAVRINRPTRIFLTFADYLSSHAAGVSEWGRLPDEVLDFVGMLTRYSGVPVAGVSTGRYQDQTAWSGSYV